MKKIGIIFLALTLLLFSFNISVFAQDLEPVNYVALGDSIAAGTGAEVGYPVLFSAYLEQKFGAVNFTDYSMNGMTSGVLDAFLRGDFSDPDFSALELPVQFHLIAIWEDVIDEISSADVISLTIGGNDFLQPILTPGFNLNAFMTDSSIIGIIDNYSSNLDSILSTLRSLKSDAVIYVTNLYNPFQERHTLAKFYPDLDGAIGLLNDTTEWVASVYGCVLVDIYSRFALFDHTEKEVLWRLPEEFWAPQVVLTDSLPYLHPTNKGQSLIFKEMRASLKYKDLAKAISDI